MPKLNLRKFSTIFRESLKLSLHNRFLKMLMIFLFLSYSRVKYKEILILIAHKSVKNHRNLIYKTDS